MSEAQPPLIEPWYATDAEMAQALEVLRASHPSFVDVAQTLIDLADDPTVSPAVYERVCKAVFTVLGAWSEANALLAS